MLHTTLKLLRTHHACEDRYIVFREAARAAGYKDGSFIPLVFALDSNGLEDTLWALRAVPQEEAANRDKLARLFACDCAERALPLYEKKYPQDLRPRNAIAVARQYAVGQATEEDLLAAEAAAAGAEATRAAWAAAEAARQWQKDRLREYLEGKVL